MSPKSLKVSVILLMVKIVNDCVSISQKLIVNNFIYKFLKLTVKLHDFDKCITIFLNIFM